MNSIGTYSILIFNILFDRKSLIGTLVTYMYTVYNMIYSVIRKSCYNNVMGTFIVYHIIIADFIARISDHTCMRVQQNLSPKLNVHTTLNIIYLHKILYKCNSNYIKIAMNYLQYLYQIHLRIYIIEFGSRITRALYIFISDAPINVMGYKKYKNYLLLL